MNGGGGDGVIADYNEPNFWGNIKEEFRLIARILQLLKCSKNNTNQIILTAFSALTWAWNIPTLKANFFVQLNSVEPNHLF